MYLIVLFLCHIENNSMTVRFLSLQEVFTEMEEKYGEVEEMNVCDNLGDHLVGNVYVKVRCRNEYRCKLERHTKWSYVIYFEPKPCCICQTIADEILIGQKKHIGCFCYFKSRTKPRKIAECFTESRESLLHIVLFQQHSISHYLFPSFPTLSIPPPLNALGHQSS